MSLDYFVGDLEQSWLVEMQRMRSDSVLDCVHPLIKLGDGSKICYSNIVSWRKHIQHVLSDKTLFLHSSVFCFTETHCDGQFQRIKDLLPEWDDEHNTDGHGVAICYNTSKVKVLKRFEYIGMLEILPLLLDIEGEQILLIAVYRPCLLYTSPSPRDRTRSRMPSSA